MSQWSIDKSNVPAVAKEAKIAGRPLQWEHWDDFMEAEFGDMDYEIVGDENKWMLEVRDAVELKRGFH